MLVITHPAVVARAQQLTALRAAARRLGTKWIESIVEPYGVVMLCDLPVHAVAAALKDAAGRGR